jgi:hypothetical protein
MKKLEEGEYGWCTFYTSMNMEHWNRFQSFYDGEWCEEENNGGDEWSRDMTCICGNVTVRALTKPPYTNKMFQKMSYGNKQNNALINI